MPARGPRFESSRGIRAFSVPWRSFLVGRIGVEVEVEE